MYRPVQQMLLAALIALIIAACGGNLESAGPLGDLTTAPKSISGQTITLVTHDSFVLSDGVLDAFTRATGVGVVQRAAGDTGQMVATAILTGGNPLGDVMFGVDNTFLQRALDADLFEPYVSPGLSGVPEGLRLDSRHRVTPIDYGDVCINYWIDRFDDDLPPPQSLADLADPAYRGLLVVQNPETSSPGLGFLLATISEYGNGWEDYWRALRDNDVLVTAGWEEAYYGAFVSGGGDRPIVVSYASSPPAEIVYADPPVTEAPTGVITDTCFRQVEFAGILSGTKHRTASEALIDFMLTPAFQEDLPLSMFVYPAVMSTALPRVFVDHVDTPVAPHHLDPATIGANRNMWTERWTDLVLR